MKKKKREKNKLTLIVVGGRHVPYGDCRNARRAAGRVGQVDDGNDPVLILGVQVLLEELLDLMEVRGVLRALFGDEVGP